MVGINAGDKVLMEFSTFGDRLLSEVTDIRDDGCLLVCSPIPDAVLKRLRIDRRVVVRFARNGKLLGFKSRVINQVNSPDSILVLDEPATTFYAEERSEPRFECALPATVVEGWHATKAVVEDLSLSCARVRFLNGDAPMPEKVGGEVDLTIRSFEGETPFTVHCRMKKIQVRDGVWFSVLEFDFTDRTARSRVAGFLHTQPHYGYPRIL